jgi:hypothetical protein
MPRECLVSRQEVYLSSSLFLSLGMDLFPRLRNQRNPSRRSLRFGDEKKMSWRKRLLLLNSPYLKMRMKLITEPL